VFDRGVYREFRNVGFSNQRRFPGVPAKSEALRRRLSAREAMQFDLQPGDVIALYPLGTGQSASLIARDVRGQDAPEYLGLSKGQTLSLSEFDSAPFRGWMTANGGSEETALGVADVLLDELAVLKAREACSVWVVRPVRAADLAYGQSEGQIEVSVKLASSGNAHQLPLPLGEIRDEFTIPRGSAQAYEVKTGEFIQIIDIEGQQCSDFTALRSDALQDGRELSVDSTATRSMVRGAYPAPGLFDKFFDAELRPMLRVIQDTCGRHDTLGVACTARGYEERGFPGHLNCSDNISAALDPYGVVRRTAWPAINFFWNTWVDEHSHQLLTEESYSRPGDYVVMRAIDNLVCASTACPDDIDPINGWNPTDVHVRIYKPEAPIRRAVAFREKEDAPMSISQESAFHPATSKLTTQYAPARDLWAPIAFPAIGTIGEYWACRERVTLQDMSSLRKYDIIGPDAERLLQFAMTRDIAKLSVWCGTYTLMCDETGAVIDDGTLFRMGPDLFRWCCGTEESARHLEDLATGQNLQVRINAMGGAAEPRTAGAAVS